MRGAVRGAQEVTGAGGAEALTSRWEVRWTPATAAMLTAAGVRGVTPAQAAEGLLRERRRTEQDEADPPRRRPCAAWSRRRSADCRA
ncbi:DUF5682 family protein [Streptomyces diastatochromogenes]|nr:DUF5682 family protein [Streptomyces diastatochromogenes]